MKLTSHFGALVRFTPAAVATAAVIATVTTTMITMPTPAFAADKTFDNKGFDALVVSSGVDVIVHQGPHDVSAKGSWMRLRKLEISQRGSELSISQDSSFLSLPSLVGKSPVVTVTMPELSAVSVSSGADLESAHPSGAQLAVRVSSGADAVFENLRADQIDVDVSSGANVTLSGVCALFIAEASSGSDIEAEGLTCGHARVTASSGADIALFATQEVTARASSGADIDVDGGAVIIAEEHSGGDVD